MPTAWRGSRRRFRHCPRSAPDLAKPPYDGSFFLIDPLDGTKEFVAGRDEFTVNLALVTNGTPLLGIIGAPALGLIWRGLVGRGAERLTTEADAAGPSRSTPGRSRSAATPGSRRSAARMAMPGPKPLSTQGPARSGKTLGSAVKFARVAEGAVDIYPRLAPDPEWDIAAGHAIVTAAGGKVTDAQGGRLAVRQGRDGFHRAGVHRLGRSCGGALRRERLSTSTAPDPARSAGQRAFACLQHARRIGGKGVAVLLAAEQIKPLARDQPEPGVAGNRDAARQIDRVVAAELGTVNLRMGDKGGAVALVAETPDRAGLGGLELRQAELGRASTK